MAQQTPQLQREIQMHSAHKLRRTTTSSVAGQGIQARFKVCEAPLTWALCQRIQ